MYLHDTQICPPKGKHKKELQSTGRHKKLEFTRYMSSLQVKNVIKRGFKEVSLESFTYLVVDGSTLTFDPVQDQDGDMLITSAAAKKGILYISGPSHVSQLDDDITRTITFIFPSAQVKFGGIETESSSGTTDSHTPDSQAIHLENTNCEAPNPRSSSEIIDSRMSPQAINPGNNHQIIDLSSSPQAGLSSDNNECKCDEDLPSTWLNPVSQLCIV